MVLQSELYLEAETPAVGRSHRGILEMIIGDVQLHFQAVPYDVAGQPDGALVPHAVSCKRLNLLVGEHCGIPDRELPFLVEKIAALYIQSRAGVDELVSGNGSRLVKQMPSDVICRKCESLVFHHQVCII